MKGRGYIPIDVRISKQLFSAIVGREFDEQFGMIGFNDSKLLEEGCHITAHFQ